MDPSPKEADFMPYLVLASPLIALAVNGLTQIVLLRSTRGSHFMRSMIGGFLAGAAGLLVLEFFLLPHPDLFWDTIAGVTVHAMTYVALSYCYFNFVNLGQSSIRIRIYSEIAASPVGLSVQDLEKDYNEKALMAMRLRRLAESGDIVKKESLFFVGRQRLVLLARIVFAAKQFLLSRKSEFH
jgi:hypothetical protein